MNKVSYPRLLGSPADRKKQPLARAVCNNFCDSRIRAAFFLSISSEVVKPTSFQTETFDTNFDVYIENDFLKSGGKMNALQMIFVDYGLTGCTVVRILVRT